MERQRSDEFNELITEKDNIINKDLFQNYFRFKSLSAMKGGLYETKNTKQNKKLVALIKSGLIDLKKEIKKMSKEEIKTEKPTK